MCDSIEILFQVLPLPVNEAQLIWKINTWQKLEGQCASGMLTGIKTDVASPLTGRGFKVTPWIDKKEVLFKGFLASVNIPTGTVSINALMQTDVQASKLVAFYLLKSFLVEKHIAAERIAELNLANAEIKEVTFTYLIPFKSHGEVLKAHEALGFIRK